MWKKLLMKLIFMSIGVTLVGCYPNSPKQNIGTVVGAVAVAGALVGGAIGASMDEQDRMRVEGAIHNNQRTYWINERTGATYTVVPTQVVAVQGYQYCRRFYTVMRKHGKKQRMDGIACRMPNGAWRVMEY